MEQVAEPFGIEVVRVHVGVGIGTEDDGHPVGTHPPDAITGPAAEEVPRKVGVLDGPRQQVARRAAGPWMFEDGEIRSPEEVAWAAVAKLAELETGLAEEQQTGQHAGEDDAIGLVRL